jgi:sulfur relay protein TusB/DsrH
METLKNSKGVEQTVLLIQDGVYLKPAKSKVYACSDDVVSRGIKTSLPLVNQGEMVAMIFEHDKIITW